MNCPICGNPLTSYFNWYIVSNCLIPNWNICTWCGYYDKRKDESK